MQISEIYVGNADMQSDVGDSVFDFVCLQILGHRWLSSRSVYELVYLNSYKLEALMQFMNDMHWLEGGGDFL